MSFLLTSNTGRKYRENRNWVRLLRRRIKALQELSDQIKKANIKRKKIWQGAFVMIGSNVDA